ncbi:MULTISPECIES: DsbA family protein [unclassified Streptomyces]|uniref:DsbA family protein n=1 Tax=unclassified Streptomyces TaxID=2593676 RepID=UPI0004C5F597|nr:DsbA family protein [Streptomyces sp. NRRL F-5630]
MNAAPPPQVEVTEYTDPLCPWAWGAAPLFARLRTAWSGGARWRRVYAILFDEDEEPAPDPAAETAWYARYVAEVCAVTGASHAPRLARVAATSWPASRVAKAAERQGPDVAEEVLRRLRASMFVRGEPADTLPLALAAARDAPGLDAARLASDAASAAVRAAVAADRAEARRPVAAAFAVADGGPHPGRPKETPAGEWRYALPTLRLRGPGGDVLVPGWRPEEAYETALRTVRG